MIWHTFFQPFIEFGFMRRALLVCLALSLSTTMLGVFLLLRRMSLMGDALSHAILPGVAVGYLVSGMSLLAMTIGGFIAGIAVALVARILQKILSFSFVAWADKLAGGAVGLAKGTLLCALALLLLQKFFAQAAFMQHSRTLPYFNALIAQVRGWLPPDLLARLGL